MPDLIALPPAPDAVAVGRILRPGLFAGVVPEDPLKVGPRRGRARTWSYAAAGFDDIALGAAVIDLGFAAQAFAWVQIGEEIWTGDTKVPLGVGASVSPMPTQPTRFRSRGWRVNVGPRGGLKLKAKLDGARVRATIEVPSAITPALLVTPTHHGGWNVTQKAAGYPVNISLRVGDRERSGEGGGWRDWTSGRQDRRTTWRWAAASGSASGQRVGINISTGMNDLDQGENVIWWDSTPYRLPVTELRPLGDVAGEWVVKGPGWDLTFTPKTVRAKTEEMFLLRSQYVQPIGRFDGTLPAANGAAIAVEGMIGVTEDHEAVW